MQIATAQILHGLFWAFLMVVAGLVFKNTIWDGQTTHWLLIAYTVTNGFLIRVQFRDMFPIV